MLLLVHLLFNSDIEDVSDFTKEKSLDDYYKWTVLFLFQIGDCYYVFNAVLYANKNRSIDAMFLNYLHSLL